MKTEFVDVSDTRKQLVVEIPSTVVDAEIDRVAKDYGKAARIPGFRPARSRRKWCASASATRSSTTSRTISSRAPWTMPCGPRGGTRRHPDIKDVLRRGRPAPQVHGQFRDRPGIRSRRLRQPEAAPAEGRRRGRRRRAGAGAAAQRAARCRAGRRPPVEAGDTVDVDLVARDAWRARPTGTTACQSEIGAASNPPGFDDQLIGMAIGGRSASPVYPDDYSITELQGKTANYVVMLKGIKKRALSLTSTMSSRGIWASSRIWRALRTRVRQDLTAEAEHAAEREVRNDLLRQLAARVTFDVPEALIDREIERRTEEFVRRLIEQGIDPRQANIDWQSFRDNQRDPSRETVASALVLDEVARREQVAVESGELDAEIEKYAVATGRTSQASAGPAREEGRYLPSLHGGYVGRRRLTSCGRVLQSLRSELRRGSRRRPVQPSVRPLMD